MGTDLSRTCRYHPDSRARWVCERCNLALDEQCKPSADQLGEPPTCPLCEKSMEDLGAGHLVTPFWRAPHEHFAYPIRRQVMLLLAALGLVVTLAPGGMLGLIMVLAAFAIATKYGFAIIEASSLGYADPPPVGQVLSEHDYAPFFRVIGMYFFYGLAFVLAAMTGSPVLFLLTLLFMTLAFPASIMVLAIERRVLAAVNPRLLSDLMWRIGWPYLVLWVLVLVLSTGPAFIANIAIAVVPDWLLAGVLLFVQGYFYFVIFRHLGYALFQYQARLGYSAGVQRFDGGDDEPAAEQWEPALALADAGIQMAEGQKDRARLTLSAGLQKYPEHPGLNDRYERLLAASDEPGELTRHLDRRLDQLVGQNHTGSALDIWLRNYRHVGDWIPKGSATRHKLATELERRGKFRQAARLLVSLPKSDPDYEELPQACLLAARIFEHGLGDSANAERLREYVRRRFPDQMQTQPAP